MARALGHQLILIDVRHRRPKRLAGSVCSAQEIEEATHGALCSREQLYPRGVAPLGRLDRVPGGLLATHHSRGLADRVGDYLERELFIAVDLATPIPPSQPEAAEPSLVPADLQRHQQRHAAVA